MGVSQETWTGKKISHFPGYFEVFTVSQFSLLYQTHRKVEGEYVPENISVAMHVFFQMHLLYVWQRKFIFLSKFTKDDKPRQDCKDSATLCTQIKKATCLYMALWVSPLDSVTEWPTKWPEVILPWCGLRMINAYFFQFTWKFHTWKLYISSKLISVPFPQREGILQIKETKKPCEVALRS